MKQEDRQTGAASLAQKSRWNGFKYTWKGAEPIRHRWGSLGIQGEVGAEEGRHKRESWGAAKEKFGSFYVVQSWAILTQQPHALAAGANEKKPIQTRRDHSG